MSPDHRTINNVESIQLGSTSRSQRLLSSVEHAIECNRVTKRCTGCYRTSPNQLAICCIEGIDTTSTSARINREGNLTVSHYYGVCARGSRGEYKAPYQ